MADPLPSRRARAGRSQAALLVLGALGGLVAAELALRMTGGGLPHLGIFVEQAGTIRLLPNAEALVRRADGVTYTVRTDVQGRRTVPGEPERACTRVVVGDSQVMGSGVEAADSFADRIQACNAGVPGYGIADALASVPDTGVQTVVVVANQANDWDEGLDPVVSRYAVRGGWLITRANADSRSAALWGSPLSRVHVLHLFGSVLLSSLFAPSAPSAPVWADPAAAAPTSTRIAGAIGSFAEAHPGLKVMVVWLPVDVAVADHPDSPFADAAARAVVPPLNNTTMRDQLFGVLATHPSTIVGDLRCTDLSPALHGRTDAFLSYDYHLSETGHTLVADALTGALAPGGW